MTYTDFANRVILALYRETEGDMSNHVVLSKLLNKYGIDVEKEFWLNNLQNEWSGNAQGQFIDAGSPAQKVAIQINGVRHAEGLPQDILPDLSALNPLNENANVSHEVTSLEPDSDAPLPFVDSTDWTGISAKISVADLADVKFRAHALIEAINQSDCDERTRQNARRHIEAIIALVEAPDPPWRVIVDLLNSPVLTAFLNTATILAIIFGK